MKLPPVVRTTLLWSHLVVGVLVALMVLSMSITGIVIAYEKQIVAMNDGYRVTAPAGTTVSISRVMSQLPTGSRVNMIAVNADSTLPAMVRLAENKTLFVNPYTGDVLGEGAKKTREFFHAVEMWHRWLAMEGASRDTGKLITGITNLLFVFLIVSGLFLWWPRRWTWKTVKPVLVPRWQLNGKARDFNWHNSLGFLIAPVLFVVVVSGTFMSFKWPAKLVNQALGVPPRAEGRAEGPGGERGAKTPPRVLSSGLLDTMWVNATHAVPDWKSMTFRWPTKKDSAANFAADVGGVGRPDQRVRVELSVLDGAVLRVQAGMPGGLKRAWQGWVKGIHTGTAGGFAGQTTALLAALVATILVCTGLMLAWRRFRAWRQRVSRSQCDHRDAIQELLAEQPVLEGVTN